MNWTEGSLNRHSHARKGKEVILRQKEHFAKVRAGVLGANVKISPPSVSLLALPPRPPSSVRSDALVSASSRQHQRHDRLTSSCYFSERIPELPPPIRLPKPETEDESIRHKRRKLLLKGDWVGTNVQKPIQMEFTKARGSPNNPWGGKRKPRHQASKQRLRRLLGVTHGEAQNKFQLSAADTLTPTSLRRIKIRVGNYERALGDSSTTSPRGNGIQVESSEPHEPGYLHPVGHHQDRDQVCVPLSDASHQSHSSASQTPLLTTSPLLFHPVPTRPALVQLLHHQSVDSDDADSTLAQLGVEHTLVPPSQADENDVWRTFVAGSDDASALNEMRASHSPEDAAEKLVSPGISQLGAPGQPHGEGSPEDAVSLVTRELKDTDESETPTVPGGRLSDEMWPDPPHQQGSEASSDDDRNASLANHYSTLRLGSDLSQPAQSSRQGNRHKHFQELNTTVGSSDGVSLLVVTSSPKTPPSLDTIGEAALFQVDQPEGMTIELDSPSPEMAMSPLYGKAKASRNRTCSAVENMLPIESKEDENEMWKKFVFGDSPENETALEEARRDAARNLRPSLPSTSTCLCQEFQSNDTTSSIDHESIERRDFAEGLYDPTGDVAIAASASRVATAGASSADTDSETTSLSIGTTIRTDQATYGSSSSSAAGNSGGRLLVSDGLRASATCETDTSPSNIDPKRLERHDSPDECFKFARPKLFVGKKIEHADERRQIALSVPQIRGEIQTRRRQRRTMDGRANIRKLPNYGSDPIEEFIEGDCLSDQAEKGSMFSALETEDGL